MHDTVCRADSGGEYVLAATARPKGSLPEKLPRRTSLQQANGTTAAELVVGRRVILLARGDGDNAYNGCSTSSPGVAGNTHSVSEGQAARSTGKRRRLGDREVSNR